MGGLLIRGLSQTSLYRLQIKEIIVFAPHHIGEPSQICDNRAIPILPVQADHSLAQWNSLRLHIDAHRAFRLSQLSPIITVARLSMPRKRANPLVRVGLEHGRPGADSLSPLAPEVAWSTDFI